MTFRNQSKTSTNIRKVVKCLRECTLSQLVVSLHWRMLKKAKGTEKGRYIRGDKLSIILSEIRQFSSNLNIFFCHV